MSGNLLFKASWHACGLRASRTGVGTESIELGVFLLVGVLVDGLDGELLLTLCSSVSVTLCREDGGVGVHMVGLTLTSFCWSLPISMVMLGLVV